MVDDLIRLRSEVHDEGGVAPANVRSLGGYRYVVSAEGGAYNGRAEVVQAAHAEAARICNGWEYRIIDGSHDSSTSVWTGSSGQVYSSTSRESVIVFECVPPRRGPPGAARR